MKQKMDSPRRSRASGQTLIIAILILGVLLILGAAFASLLARSTTDAGRGLARSAAGAAAESAIRVAHSRLVESSEGADWRPEPASLGAGPTTRDPDALFLRPATGLLIAPDPARPTARVRDLGGPDYLGPYSRIETDRGRALVRVRYAASDFDAFAAGRSDAFRNAGLASRYILIEGVGRERRLTQSGRIDPTLALDEAVRISGFSSAGQLAAEVGRMRGLDRQIGATERLAAIASIGMLESARFITDKSRTGQPVELGLPVGDGAEALAASSGASVTEPDGALRSTVGLGPSFGRAVADGAAATAGRFLAAPGFGSLYSNAPLKVYGEVTANLNVSLGEAWRVAGAVEAGEPGSRLVLNPFRYADQTRTWKAGTPFQFTGAESTSFRPGFTSRSAHADFPEGLLVDGWDGPDSSGQARNTPRKEAPAAFTDQGESRYHLLTRDTGDPAGRAFTGQYGFGEGVYVDSSERGNRSAQDWRFGQTPSASLPKDWLRPNNPDSTGWQGPYYVPVAAQLRLRSNGFEIIRDARSAAAEWFDPASGSGAGTVTASWRLRRIGAEVFSLNSIENPALMALADASVSDATYQADGRRFNGTILFEGDARVRGVIPAGVQLTVACGGTLYIDGSITRPSVSAADAARRSAIALMARDHVAVNTTLFTGPAPGQSLRVKASDLLPDTPNPIELNFGAPQRTLQLESELIADPETGTAGQPATWQPHALGYRDLDGRTVQPTLLLAASAEDGGPSFASIFVRPGSGAATADSPFLFPNAFDLDATGGTLSEAFNAASPFYPVDPLAARDPLLPLYGLGDASINAYPRFERVGMPLFGTAAFAGGALTDAGRGISYPVGPPTIFDVRPETVGSSPQKSFLVARSAIQMHDVRIEAMIYAQEGSFYVIPGPPFNSNTDDTRAAFEARRADDGREIANRDRYRRTGSSPSAPFYDEPLTTRVRIVGSITESRPAPVQEQSEWLRRWGWLPAELGSTGHLLSANPRPNFELAHDPVLATGTFDGVSPVRSDAFGRPLPPLPNLPVSPSLLFFGEVNR